VGLRCKNVYHVSVAMPLMQRDASDRRMQCRYVGHHGASLKLRTDESITLSSNTWSHCLNSRSGFLIFCFSVLCDAIQRCEAHNVVQDLSEARLHSERVAQSRLDLPLREGITNYQDPTFFHIAWLHNEKWDEVFPWTSTLFPKKNQGSRRAVYCCTGGESPIFAQIKNLSKPLLAYTRPQASMLM